MFCAQLPHGSGAASEAWLKTPTDILLLAVGAIFYTIASPPYDWSAAAWIALTPLFLVLHGKTPRAGFVVGLGYGVFACVGVTWWVHFAISAYFSLPFPLDVLCTFLSYVVFGGLYMGMVSALTCMVLAAFARGGVPVALRWCTVPALWVCGEFARSSLLTGFSWGILGYTQHSVLPLIQIVDITGVYGLSFLLVFSSDVAAETLIALGLFRRQVLRASPSPSPWKALGCLAVVLAFSFLYGEFRLRQYAEPLITPPLTVALVQSNIPTTQRWQRLHYGNTLLAYLSLTRRGVAQTHPDLVVWPEFALGFYLDKEPRLRAQLNWLTHELKTFLLVGAPRREDRHESTQFYNSAYLLAPGGKVADVYDKMRLVPFAEHRIPWLPALTPHSAEAPSEFTAGNRSTIFVLPGGTFGAMICYEVTYPRLARQLVRGGAQFLVNISNDTWLHAGGKAATAQHFALAVLRAVENRRGLVRAATQGISGFVDPTGRPLRVSTAPEGVLLGQVTPQDTVTWYARYGDWFVGICGSFALASLLWVQRGGRHARGPA